MICEKPYIQGISCYPCGRCGPCLAKRRQVWAHRLELEASQHGDNAFVTLTYRDSDLPKVEGVPTLCPVHTRNWLKRLRKSFEPQRLRFFLVGEYGTLKERPHYHALLFGYPTCLNGQTILNREKCCSVCSAVQKTWDFGSVQVARVEPRSIQYVCGYVLKKMTSHADLRLGGRHPEFARMSSVPGIGATAMDDVAQAIMQANLKGAQNVLPTALSYGRRKVPLGRYLVSRLRKRTNQLGSSYQKEEMYRLLGASIASNGNSVAAQSLEESEAKRASFEWKLRNMGKKHEKV